MFPASPLIFPLCPCIINRMRVDLRRTKQKKGFIMARIRLSRAGRKAQIIHAMAKSEYSVHTVNSIAKLIRIKPSSYLRALLKELLIEGEMDDITEVWDDGSVRKRYYSLEGHMPKNEMLDWELDLLEARD